MTNTEKTMTDGKLNFETATTKAVMIRPQMEHEKKEKNLIKGKHRLKNENKGGEKTDSSDDEVVFVKINLNLLINEPLSDKYSNKTNQIIKNKEAKPGDKYIYYENKKVSWGSMRRLLNLDTTEKALTKRWINNEVINFYFKKYLTEMDQERCQEEPE
jgi:hypothetical protein